MDREYFELDTGFKIERLSIYKSFRTIGGKYCYYCGQELFQDINKTADHFWPKSLGGYLKVKCCKKCNKLKDNMTPNQWIEYLKTKGSQYYTLDQINRMIQATKSLWGKVKWSL